MNTRETTENHRYKIEDSGSRGVIHSGVASLGLEIEIGPDALVAMIRDGRNKPCAIDRALDAPLRLGYTGGTTRKSKAVTLTTRAELTELTAFLTDPIPDIKQGATYLHAAPIR